jgi:hypothetical protein
MILLASLLLLLLLLRCAAGSRFTRSVLHITSHGTPLEAWLYLPKHSSR